MFADNYLVVDRTRVHCDDGRIGQAYVKCYKTKEEDKNYVTILKRFDKPISAVGLQEWLNKHFNNVENWCIRYWKPSCVEVVYRRLFDDNDINAPTRLVWSYCNGKYYDSEDHHRP
jgi:hypothetical protein